MYNYILYLMNTIFLSVFSHPMSYKNFITINTSIHYQQRDYESKIPEGYQIKSKPEDFPSMINS